MIYFLSILLINQNNSSFDTSTFENILSENLDQYIDDERLLNFKIQFFIVFIEKYSKSEKYQNGLSQNAIEFLFKCLDKYKREAYVLFTFVGIEKIQSEYLKGLLTQYSEVFNFHFINLMLAKSLYEIQNEMIVKDQQNQMWQKNFKENVNDQLLQLKSEINAQKQKEEEHSNEMKVIKKEIENLKSDNTKLINEQKQKRRRTFN